VATIASIVTSANAAAADPPTNIVRTVATWSFPPSITTKYATIVTTPVFPTRSTTDDEFRMSKDPKNVHENLKAQKDQTSKRPANHAIKANGPSYIQLY